MIMIRMCNRGLVASRRWTAFGVVALALCILPFLIFECRAESPLAAVQANSNPRFLDVAGRVGVHFTHYNDFQPERFFLPEIMGGGAAWIDYDGDGRLDLYLVNGCELPYNPANRKHISQLFRNLDGQRFELVTPRAGVSHNGYGQGSAVGDLDNDGFDELVVTCYGQNVLYRNHGDGTFREIAGTVGVQSDARWHSSAAWGDLDRDGSLDLYVACYVKTTLDDYPRCKDLPTKSLRVYCGPSDYEAEQHRLFRNDGSGLFHEITEAAGCNVPNGKGLGVVIADVDQDRWPDIFVANDMTPSFLFRNLGAVRDGGPRFEEVGMRVGLAMDGDGRPVAGMGIAAGDYDADGWLDFYVTHFYQQGNTLYRNLRGRVFMDRSTPTGLTRLSWNYLGFGTGFMDFDLDGWLDLFSTNGHVLGPHVDPYWMRPQLYRNEQGNRFSDVSNGAGDYFRQKWLGRGAAFADYDNDGAEDIAVVHHFRPTALLHNETSQRGHFVQIRLVGRESSRSAFTARVLVHAGSRTLARDVVGGGSYLSANDTRLTVGLGNHSGPIGVDIEWPSGKRESRQDLAVDRAYMFVEGKEPSLGKGG